MCVKIVIDTWYNYFFLCPRFLLLFYLLFFSTASPVFQVLGLLVWTLIAGTEYFRVPAFGWVMFVAVFYWVLTVFFLIIYITMTYTRIPQVPWTTVVRTWIGWSLVLQSIWDRLCPQRRGQSQGETARNLEIQLPFKYFRSETACWKVQKFLLGKVVTQFPKD